MSLFEKLNQPQNMQQAVERMKANPIAMLKQAGFNVPENLNTPPDIINYLLKSGQVNQQRLQQIMSRGRR